MGSKFKNLSYKNQTHIYSVRNTIFDPVLKYIEENLIKSYMILWRHAKMFALNLWFRFSV